MYNSFKKEPTGLISGSYKKIISVSTAISEQKIKKLFLFTLQTNTRSMPNIGTLEKGVKYVQN